MMSYGPNKQGYHNQDNCYPVQYPPINQSLSLSYSQYPQQPMSGIGYTAPGTTYYIQSPSSQQPSVVITPLYRPIINSLMPTLLTYNIKTFLVISGIIYFLLGILAYGLEIGIIVNSFWTFYRGFWAGTFLIGTGIVMLIIACRASYPLIYLTRILGVILGISALGLIFSIINYSASTQCFSSSLWNCDGKLASDLKVAILVIFILAVIHTAINLAVIIKTHRRTLLASNPKIPTY